MLQENNKQWKQEELNLIKKHIRAKSSKQRNIFINKQSLIIKGKTSH